MKRAFWWEIEGAERISPIFPNTINGRHMHRLYFACLAAVYSDQRPPIQAVVKAAAELGHGEEEALDSKAALPIPTCPACADDTPAFCHPN